MSSLPQITNASYFDTPLNELIEEYKINYGSTKQKSPKVSEKNSPIKKRRERDAPTIMNGEFDIAPLSPRVDISKQLPHISEDKPYTKPSTKGTSKRKHEIILPEINRHPPRSRLINEKVPLPPIGKKAGKRRTRKHKSNRSRRTLKK